MRKNVLSRGDVIVDGDMSSSITSDALDVLHLDNVDFLVSWTGTSPAGEIKVEVTNDDINNLNITPQWKELVFSTNIVVASNTGDDLISIRQVPGRYIRIKFVRTSGSGTMQVTMTGRML